MYCSWLSVMLVTWVCTCSLSGWECCNLIFNLIRTFINMGVEFLLPNDLMAWAFMNLNPLSYRGRWPYNLGWISFQWGCLLFLYIRFYLIILHWSVCAIALREATLSLLLSYQVSVDLILAVWWAHGLDSLLFPLLLVCSWDYEELVPFHILGFWYNSSVAELVHLVPLLLLFLLLLLSPLPGFSSSSWSRSSSSLLSWDYWF